MSNENIGQCATLIGTISTPLGYEYYTGDYNIAPAFESKSFEVKGQMMTENLQIKPVMDAELTDGWKMRIIKYKGEIPINTLFKDKINIEEIDLSIYSMDRTTDLSNLFLGCANLRTIDLSPLDTSNVTNMTNMFNGCTNLIEVDVSPLDTSNVSSMSGMFSKCEQLSKIDLSNFRTPKLVNISGMFNNCKKLTEVDLSVIDVSNVENMDSTFSYSGIKSMDIKNLNLKSLVNMNAIFSGTANLSSVDMSDMILPNLIECSSLFNNSQVKEFKCANMNAPKLKYFSSIGGYNCANLTNIDMSNVNFPSLVSIGGSFKGSGSSLTLNMSNANLSSLTNFDKIFYSNKSITNVDMSGINLTSMTDMGGVFSSCSNLESVDMHGAIIPNLTTVGALFYNCYKLTSLDMSDIDVSNVINTFNAFRSCTGLIDYKSAKWCTAISFDDCSKLSHDSLMSIINNLATVTSKRILTLGSTNKAKLTADEIAIATEKGVDRGMIINAVNGITTITPDTGKYLTDGEVYSDSIVYLGIFDSLKNWSEVDTIPDPEPEDEIDEPKEPEEPEDEIDEPKEPEEPEEPEDEIDEPKEPEEPNPELDN